MLNIVTLGDERLQKHSIVVPDFDGEIQTLTEQMFETMYAKKGIGLAAVQVGKLIRLFITHIPNDGPRVFINPEVMETSVEQGTYEEGCLSVPEINADVIRPAHVRVQAWNLKGRPFSFEADQLLARVIQHELDHLNGLLFIDRLNPKKRERLVRRYEKPSTS
jgi:peptide deformylase